jgi:hypothetical protein
VRDGLVKFIDSRPVKASSGEPIKYLPSRGGTVTLSELTWREWAVSCLQRDDIDWSAIGAVLIVVAIGVCRRKG